MNIYVGFLLVYLFFLVAVAFRYSRRVRTQEDFSVAGRSLNAFVLFGTLLATWIGTGSIFGNAEKTYRVGVAAIIIPISSLAGICILYFLASRARGLRGITVQDLLERRYNAGARLMGTICLVIAYSTIVSYQYRAAGAVLNLPLPGLSVEKSILIVTSFIILYTALAGMISIAYVGVIQGVTMILGVSLALPVFWSRAGGLSGMSRTLDASHFQLFGPISVVEAVGILLPAFLLILGDANMYQRFFSARDQGTAKRAVLWMLGGVAFMESAIILCAWVASSLEPDLEIHGRVIAFAARDHLPPLLGAFMLTTIMAIVLSTAGSYLLAPAHMPGAGCLPEIHSPRGLGAAAGRAAASIRDQSGPRRLLSFHSVGRVSGSCSARLYDLRSGDHAGLDCLFFLAPRHRRRSHGVDSLGNGGNPCLVSVSGPAWSLGDGRRRGAGDPGLDPDPCRRVTGDETVAAGKGRTFLCIVSGYRKLSRLNHRRGRPSAGPPDGRPPGSPLRIMPDGRSPWVRFPSADRAAGPEDSASVSGRSKGGVYGFRGQPGHS